MRERCGECGRKRKRPRNRECAEPFGASTIDELAQAIYTTFHGHDALADEPWDLFSNQDDDGVVVAFRDAAYAVKRALDEAGIGRAYDNERDW
jgi:hypothetical protein